MGEKFGGGMHRRMSGQLDRGMGLEVDRGVGEQSDGGMWVEGWMMTGHLDGWMNGGMCEKLVGEICGGVDGGMG